MKAISCHTAKSLTLKSRMDCADNSGARIVRITSVKHGKTKKGNPPKYVHKYTSDRNPFTNEEVICKHCNFKTRYQFVRCPECGKTRE